MKTPDTTAIDATIVATLKRLMHEFKLEQSDVPVEHVLLKMVETALLETMARYNQTAKQMTPEEADEDHDALVQAIMAMVEQALDLDMVRVEQTTENVH